MSIVSYLRALTQLGPKYVIVTDGARALETKIVGTAGAGDAFGATLRPTWRSAVVSTRRLARLRSIRHQWSSTSIPKQAYCDVTNLIRRQRQDNEPLEGGPSIIVDLSLDPSASPLTSRFGVSEVGD